MVMVECFKGICPSCDNEVEGSWDWERGNICVQGECPVCGYLVLEDEGNWVPCSGEGAL